MQTGAPAQTEFSGSFGRAAADRRNQFPLYIFELRRGTKSPLPAYIGWGLGDYCTVAKDAYHARKAAAALLKMAQATSDRDVAARLIEAAADLKDQTGELPPRLSVKPPDVQTGG